AQGPSAYRHQLRIAGGGRFGAGRGAILWAGIDGDVDRLRQLVRAVGRSLRAARFPLERRAYRPHLTIARPGARLDRDALAEDIALLSGYQGPLWPVTELHLVRSHLGPDPRHERTASFPLPA
ncbi:MAG: 2'-5' RNA ligase family protein, partial [Micromonosporaceae bacterium]